MTTTNKKVKLGAVGTEDRLGSVVRGSEDGGTEESVHGLGDGSCVKSVRFEGFKSNACTTINTKRRRMTTDDNFDSTTSHHQRRPLDAPAREKPPRAVPHEVQRSKDRELGNRCRPDVTFPGQGR